MTKIIVREATKEDVDYIADHLREADVIELRAAQYTDPAAAVRTGWGWSDWTNAVLVDDAPAILYGVAPTGKRGQGSPWMLATDGIHAIQRKFLIGSRGEVDRMRARYSVLINQVHRGNTLSIKWLKWLGFTLYPEPAGPNGQFFTFSLGDQYV